MKPLRGLKFSSKNLCLTLYLAAQKPRWAHAGGRMPAIAFHRKCSMVPMKRVPSSCLVNPSIQGETLLPSGQFCFPM